MYPLMFWGQAWTGTPRWRGGGSRWILLILLLLLVAGCKKVVYKPVQECTVVRPPDVEGFMAAGPNERQVIMTSAYINQVREVSACNLRIRATNTLNESKDRQP